MYFLFGTGRGACMYYSVSQPPIAARVSNSGDSSGAKNQGGACHSHRELSSCLPGPGRHRHWPEYAPEIIAWICENSPIMNTLMAIPVTRTIPSRAASTTGTNTCLRSPSPKKMRLESPYAADGVGSHHRRTAGHRLKQRKPKALHRWGDERCVLMRATSCARSTLPKIPRVRSGPALPPELRARARSGRGLRRSPGAVAAAGLPLSATGRPAPAPPELGTSYRRFLASPRRSTSLRRKACSVTLIESQCSLTSLAVLKARLPKTCGWRRLSLRN